MKKNTENHRYIDEKTGKLKTANNLYQESLTLMSEVRAIHKADGLEKAADGYRAIENYLRESLLFGKAEAASGIAYLYKEGLGVEKSEYNSKLFIAIGSKLGDEGCKNLKKGDFSDVEPEAQAWVNTIKEVGKKYPNQDAEITTAMLAESRIKLNQSIKSSNIIEGIKEKSEYIKVKPLAPSLTPNVAKKTTKKGQSLL